ncbi:MAG TPA: hypothetical protein VEK08_09275 [Planctomycetota bacterium]|nr:hypothetical protein [Planctomycetota bacterium]
MRIVFHWGLLFIWLALSILGTLQLMRYGSIPGKTGNSPLSKPQGFSSAESTRHKLYLALHPKCPCSAATLDELTHVISQAPNGLDVVIFFYKPKDQEDNWVDTRLWREAATLPGVQRVIDVDGLAAEQLGAPTSGDAVLYGPTGTLLFHGGLTSSRGQRGESIGRSAILARLNGETPATTNAPVYGCQIQREISR